MFPHQELNELAQRKALLQANIALCRLECRVAAVELSRPLAMVDRGVEFWRKVSPFAKLLAVPAGLLIGRFLGGGRSYPGGGGRGKLATVASLLPLLWRGVRLFLSARTAVAAVRKTAEPDQPRGPGG